MDLQTATSQLDRVLGFFPRVEGKAAFLFAFDTAALAFMAVNVHRGDITIWYIAIPGLAASTMQFASIYFVCRCFFPSLSGGSASLFYFREIARRTETTFIEEFTSRNDEQLTRDVLGQVWRNAQIVTVKFGAVKTAFILSAVSIPPMTVFLAAVAWTHEAGLIFK